MITKNSLQKLMGKKSKTFLNTQNKWFNPIPIFSFSLIYFTNYYQWFDTRAVSYII